MSYLQFDKNQLINLEYSLGREMLRSNRSGSFASTTLVGCNTRKYHGLLICPCHKKSEDRHLLLSSLDVTVVQHEQEFNLGIHKYQGDLFIPKGHKYIRDFEAETTAVTTYRVGNVILERESLLVENQEQILIRFTLLESQAPTILRFRPFLAFRNIHQLSKANLYANTKYRNVENGISSRMYDDFPNLYMQFSKENEFIAVPDWYYNIEYIEEQKRGYDYKEDLFVPGYFELKMRSGESVVFSASTRKANPSALKRRYTSEKSSRLPRNSFLNCLKNSAEQFIVKNERGVEIIAGFPWFGTWGRDTFISLPGLTLSTGNTDIARKVIKTMIKSLKNGLFPNTGDSRNPAYNSVDAPLWFIWSLQEFEKYENTDVWKEYGKAVKSVLQSFREGTLFNIKMQENGLIYAGTKGKALTWMDALTRDGAVTPRIGFPVEINALWYNAVVQSLKWAEMDGDQKFIGLWKDLPDRIRESFFEHFWLENEGYLADYISNEGPNTDVRPNMIIAASLDHSMLSQEMKNSILEIVRSELLTPRGLRTLSPKNPRYEGIYEGDQDTRDKQYHQGTVWPWLLEHYAKAYLNVHKNAGISHIKSILMAFEEDMTEYGVSTVAEIYDGDPPHHPKGAISQAWSVAALLRINEMLENLSAKTN